MADVTKAEPTDTRHSKESAAKTRHDRWIATPDAHETVLNEGKKLRNEIANAARIAMESNRCSDEVASSEGSASARPTDTVVEQGGLQETAEFLPALYFMGKKEGYVFHLGKHGLGYYLDVRAMTTLASGHVSQRIVDPTEMMASIQPNVFEYDFRQTEEAVALIIQVKDIIESSVHATFGSKGFDISFSANIDNAADYTTGPSLREYAMGFDCSGNIDTKLSKFDVATQNMVIILHKCEPGIWDCGIGDDTIVKPRLFSRTSDNPSVKDPLVKNAMPSDTEKTATFGLKSMQFSVSGLLDLD